MTRTYKVIVCEDLREIDSGIHYARSKEEVLNEYPFAIEFYEKYSKDSFSTKYTDGESEFDVYKRVKGIADKIKKIKEYGNLLSLHMEQ